MSEQLNHTAGIAEQLPDVPLSPDSSQPELKAINTRDLIINNVESKISWDEEVVADYFEICGAACEYGYLKLKHIKSLMRQCRTLYYRAGIQKHYLVRGLTSGDGDDKVDQQQIGLLKERMEEAQRRWMQIARVQKQ